MSWEAVTAIVAVVTLLGGIGGGIIFWAIAVQANLAAVVIELRHIAQLTSDLNKEVKLLWTDVARNTRDIAVLHANYPPENRDSNI